MKTRDELNRDELIRKVGELACKGYSAEEVAAVIGEMERQQENTTPAGKTMSDLLLQGAVGFLREAQEALQFAIATDGREGTVDTAEPWRIECRKLASELVTMVKRVAALTGRAGR